MKSHSVEVGPEQPNGGRIRRSALMPEELLRIPDTTVHTLFDVLNYSMKKYGDRQCFGFRSIEREIEEEKDIIKYVNGEEVREKKKWKYFQLSGYKYLTYRQVAKETRFLGAGLIHLGLSEKSKLEIFAPTNMAWLLTAHGAFTQNMTIVTAYDTLGEEGLLHSMNETQVEAIFTSGELLPTVTKVANACPSLKFVFFAGDAKPEHVEKMKEVVPQVYTLNQVADMGKNHPIEPKQPEPEDVCCIMYTSGSTGNPKGVILTHKNIVGAIAGVDRLLGHHVTDQDSILAYLPLAHVLEFVVENVAIFWGVTLGYANVRTLTDASVRNCKGDIKEFRPTLMTGVPAVWESIRKGVLGKVNGASPKAQSLFHKAFKSKAWLMERKLPTTILDKLVFNKIREQVGGRLRFALSGGAPLSIETQRFLSVTICPILGGYGMTESCGMACVVGVEQFSYGPVGAPVPCVEVKLVDVPDANYFSTNYPKPQGEIWVRGPAVTTGYWKREDITKETFTEDGWLQTGDIGEWNENGTLSVIDRKKNLVKLSNGEYIALEKLESVYKSCIYAQNMCVFADSLLPRPVALVVPVEAALRQLAQENKIDSTREFDDLCNDQAVNKLFLRSLLAQGKEAGLKPAENLAAIHLCSDEWTTDSGLLTAAQKIKRQDIVKKYKAELDTINATQKA
ncbi:acetyl-CoA synthetase-like protein [Hesseltinella vesiculosa]|uniref:Acetyl-CoA synthetase-like protein n=1 Tax=Hesseltinella vesiculosa TaxID=101127 RepID=A0A1X2GF08_9FUNG|nr:acetyl-CoA synthetase-like protein [Hesseltinella vesiculosa]